MRRRLYWLLPDVDSARKTANDLLLSRIEDRHMHFLARPGIDLGELHEASVMQQSDVRHAAGTGFVIGGLLGGLCAALLSIWPVAGLELAQGAVLAMIGGGGLFGVFMSTLIGSSVPNSKLAQFMPDVERGSVLLMVDVPLYRVDTVRELLERRHPEASWRGVDPSIPAFP
jgi:hypothetical protein